MRILSLELERYGSFTDRSLEFKPVAHWLGLPTSSSASKVRPGFHFSTKERQ
jgi:hypothetical protein